MAEQVGLKDLYDVFYRVDLVPWLKINPKTMNTCLNALEMLVTVWMIIYSFNRHRHLYARYKSLNDEHVTSLPLRNSKSGENVGTNNTWAMTR